MRADKSGYEPCFTLATIAQISDMVVRPDNLETREILPASAEKPAEPTLSFYAERLGKCDEGACPKEATQGARFPLGPK
jgi:hypothetical protein